MRSIARPIHNALALLLQMDPSQQIWAVSAVLLFIIALNLASNVLYDVLKESWLGTVVLIMSPVLVLICAIYILNKLQRGHPTDEPPQTDSLPSPRQGLILMLSTFNPSLRPADDSGTREYWSEEELEQAIDMLQPAGKQAYIELEEKLKRTNMMPAIEAIRHHSRELKHVWIISTVDEKVSNQRGSHHFAPLFAKMMQKVFVYDHLVFHYNLTPLRVRANSMSDTYQAVKFIFEQDGSRIGLHPDQIIADLTGARVPMSCGMVMACQPNNWPMQFTSTQVDPAMQKGGRPVPLAVHIDLNTVIRQTLKASESRL